MIKITLSLFAVMALTLAAPLASAHCGTCDKGDKKHEHKEGEKCCGTEGKCCKAKKEGEKKACAEGCEKECCTKKEEKKDSA